MKCISFIFFHSAPLVILNIENRRKRLLVDFENSYLKYYKVLQIEITSERKKNKHFNNYNCCCITTILQ